MTPETKKTLFLAAAAVAAGGVSVPVLSWVGGKTFSMAGSVGPYIAPIGAVGAGALLAVLGRSHPAALAAGVALAAVGGYGLVTTFQAERAASQPGTTTAGNLVGAGARGGGGGMRHGGSGHYPLASPAPVYHPPGPPTTAPALRADAPAAPPPIPHHGGGHPSGPPRRAGGGGPFPRMPEQRSYGY